MDFYKALQIIGLSSNYTEKELRKKYHDLARTYHPDAYVDKSLEEQKMASDKMKEINEAYDILAKSLKDEKSFQSRPSYCNYTSHQNEDIKVNLKKHKEKILSFIEKNRYVNSDISEEFMGTIYNFNSFVAKYIAYVANAESINLVDNFFDDYKKELKDWYHKFKNIYFTRYLIPESFDFEIDINLSINEFYEHLVNFKHDYDNVIKKIDNIISPYKLYTYYEDIKNDIEKLREEAINNVCDDYNMESYYYINLRHNLDNLFKYYSINKPLYAELEEIINNNSLPFQRKFQRKMENLRENIYSPLFYLYYIELKLNINNLLDYQIHEGEIADIENNLTQKYNEALKNINDDNEKKELYFFYKSVVHYLKTPKNVSFQSIKLLNEIDFNNYEEVLKIHDKINNNLITNKRVEIYINKSEQNAIASIHIKFDDEEYDIYSVNGEDVVYETNNMDNNFISLDEFMPSFATFDWNGESCIGLYNYYGLCLCVYKGHLQFLSYPARTNIEWYPDYKFGMFQNKDYVKSLLINQYYQYIELCKKEKKILNLNDLENNNNLEIKRK